ncbi:A24 family peptidase [Vibrio alginolyticus]|uniref:A24 family peptidase n=1 Tax=Vibrio alginolyticus TaxID=663 RepID=UPI003BA1EC88
MVSELIIWSLLIAIGVSDAQKHRIPNKAVLMLLVAVTANVIYNPATTGLDHLYGGLVAFAVCFALYLFKVMAGGDVKLLAVIGAWLGLSNLGEASIGIILAGGIVGIFYLMLHVSSTSVALSHQIKGYCLEKVTPGCRSSKPLVIPFAPIIVIGLAYFSYTH